MNNAESILGAEGPFLDYIPGFAPRLQQQELAATIDDTIKQQSVLIAEAGTGTGKTFAYLVPAVTSGQKVIISTGTKNLQDQLYYNDLPIVINALGSATYAVQLKGRANYICNYRLDKATTDGRLSPTQIHYVGIIANWLSSTKVGDISELDEIPSESTIWTKVTSTTDNCLGTDCPNIGECYVLKARKLATQADIVIVNHHLFFADMALKEEGFGEVIPNADVFIFDEAHQILNIAPDYFGYSVSSHKIESFVHDYLKQIKEDAPEISNSRLLIKKLLDTLSYFRNSLGDSDRRASWWDVKDELPVDDGLKALGASLIELEQNIHPHIARSIGLERCWQRLTELIHVLDQFHSTHSDSTGQNEDEAEMISWFETKSQRFSLHKTPMNIANIFRKNIEDKSSSWVFTSATLAIKNDFAFFKQSLGIENCVCKQWQSPFDFNRQAILYIPKEMPDPRSNKFVDAIVVEIIRLVEVCQGRTFVLVTSHRVLNFVAAKLKGSISYPLLVQGTMPSDLLIRRFRDLGNAVLVGTSSFWQGVDVKGQSLSCVIIDKLPFAAPDDPKVQATINYLRAQGRNPFMEYQLPQAVIGLKQGAGRLIRDTKDMGVLAICDPRLVAKPFGKVFIKSLPQMAITQDFNEVKRFSQHGSILTDVDSKCD